ncbi:MAG TPA: serine/threonine-protein kinase [Kofleriaceae bacterium]|nr:serine/threonine-protein kinase [Kofleriaceae bacterium]
MRRDPAPSPAPAALLSSPSSPSAPGRTARGSQPGEKREPGARLRCPTCLVPFRATFTRCPRDGSSLSWQTDDPLIGSTFADRYVLEALVGEGAMGLVYRAHHARLSHRLFAVKIMFGDVAAEAAMRMRFAQEADAASRFCHPNVVSVLDFGRTERGILYLAMDYVDGETLASLIRRQGPLDESRVVSLTRQLARGLGHAHNAGLVHRDFKPANIAIAVGDGGCELARVLDFGLAISERAGDRVGRLTEHGLVVGTPIYIAPEQARDQAVDHRADLFALGVVMYEMLSGKTPFEGSGAEIARANVQQKPPPLSQRNAQVQVTPELEAIVFKLLEKRPSDRYQSAEEVIAALDRFERSTRPVAPAQPPAAEPATSIRPVLWLSGRSPRPWGREVTPPARRATPAEQQPATWGSGLDGTPTLGMTPATVNRMRRRGMTAVAWVASAVAAALVATTLAGSHGLGRSAKAATVADEDRSSAPLLPDALLASGRAALDLFEVKMAATPSRCSNVPHAERIAAESPTASHARSAVKAQKRRARPKLSSRPRNRTVAVRDPHP